MPWCQSQRGGHLSAIGKLRGVTDERDQRRGDQRANVTQMLKPTCVRFAMCKISDRAVQFADAIVGDTQTDSPSFYPSIGGGSVRIEDQIGRFASDQK